MLTFLWKSIKYTYKYYSFTHEEKFSYHLDLAIQFAQDDYINLANKQIMLAYLARIAMKDGYLLPSLDVLLAFYSPHKLILDQVYAEYASNLEQGNDYPLNKSSIANDTAKILFAMLSAKAADEWDTRSIEMEWWNPRVHPDYAKRLISEERMYDLLTPLLIMKGDYQLIVKTRAYDYYPQSGNYKIWLNRKGLQAVWDEGHWTKYDEMISCFKMAFGIYLRLQERAAPPLTHQEIIRSVSLLNRFLHINLENVSSTYQPHLILIQLYALQFRDNKQYIKNYYYRLGKKINDLQASSKECIKDKYLYDFLLFLSKENNINNREINNIRNALVHTVAIRQRQNIKSTNFAKYQPLLKLNFDSELLTILELRRHIVLKSRYSTSDVMAITRPSSLFKTSASFFSYQDIGVKTTNEQLLSHQYSNQARQ